MDTIPQQDTVDMEGMEMAGELTGIPMVVAIVRRLIIEVVATTVDMEAIIVVLETAIISATARHTEPAQLL